MSNAGDANTLSRFDTAYHANSGKAIAVYSTDATTIKSSTINFSGSTPVKSDEQTMGTNRSGVNPDGPHGTDFNNGQYSTLYCYAKCY